MKRWARANHQPNLPLENGKYVTACKEHVLLSKEAATEGMVLLKNENNRLPLKSGAKVALFGKGTFDYVKGGGGSGDVHSAYIRNLYEGLKELKEVEIFEPLAEYYRANVAKQYADGAVPGMTAEPELTAKQVREAADFADTAIVVISRFSGEGWDRSSIECEEEYNPWKSDAESMPAISGRIFPKGDFYLTKEEEEMIARVEENWKIWYLDSGSNAASRRYSTFNVGGGFKGDEAMSFDQAVTTMRSNLKTRISGMSYVSNNNWPKVSGAPTLQATEN